MKLYTFIVAPNPTKVRVYLAEKGLSIPTQRVNLLEGEQKQPAFKAINPLGALPVLELDDGTHLSESLAIIEYLEELHPDPPMIGREPVERARVREIERSIDIGILMRAGRIMHATRSPLPGVEPVPEIAEREKARLPAILAVVDQRIGSQPFVCGERPSIADCTLFAGLSIAEFATIEIDAECKNLHRWFESFKKRPSAKG